MTPYNPTFVTELKSMLRYRKWNQEKKIWAVDIRERQKALEIIKRFFPVIEDNKPPEVPPSLVEELKKSASQTHITAEWLAGGNLEIWIDGACVSNPGPGGYGIVFCSRGQKKVKSGGFRLTTNNRMEIIAAIVALETLKEKSNVVIYSDSQYLVDAIMRGWARRWKSNNWKRNRKEKAINPDLWDRLLQLCEKQHVEFRWIRGHGFQTENEWCDQLAEAAAREPDLPVDSGYEPNNRQ
jgi:ribonuclease HI